MRQILVSICFSSLLHWEHIPPPCLITRFLSAWRCGRMWTGDLFTSVLSMASISSSTQQPLASPTREMLAWMVVEISVVKHTGADPSISQCLVKALPQSTWRNIGYYWGQSSCGVISGLDPQWSSLLKTLLLLLPVSIRSHLIPWCLHSCENSFTWSSIINSCLWWNILVPRRALLLITWAGTSPWWRLPSSLLPTAWLTWSPGLCQTTCSPSPLTDDLSPWSPYLSLIKSCYLRSG